MVEESSIKMFSDVEQFKFPHGMPYSFDIRHTFGFLRDVLEFIRDPNDYNSCNDILLDIKNNSPSSLEDFSLDNLLFIQKILFRYETGDFSKEAYEYSEDVMLIIIKDKLQKCIELKKN